MERRDIGIVLVPAGLVVALIGTVLLFRTHVIPLPLFLVMATCVFGLVVWAVSRLGRMFQE